MNKPSNNIVPIALSFSWKHIDTVLLDMDGTLLDKYFDDYFWETYVPEVYGKKHQLSVDGAREELLAKYKSVENTLQWTDLDYWSKRLGLDIPGMKEEINHLIQPHPHVTDFFRFVKQMGKGLYLVTNAHPKTLAIKLEKTGIGPYFDDLICSEDVGAAKEQDAFWQNLKNFIPFDKKRTLFADDTEKVLRAADGYGIEYLVHVARPSSKLPDTFSNSYPSITTFKELLA